MTDGKDTIGAKALEVVHESMKRREAQTMSETDTSEAAIKDIIKYAIPVYLDCQSGKDTDSPAFVFADADYEVGDGSCGLFEIPKCANEPVIPYVRIDSYLHITAERDALQARVDELEGALRKISAGWGQCVTCGKTALPPNGSYVSCDNGYCVWGPTDPADLAATALKALIAGDPA